jgi:uncharacterized protein YcnI
VIRAGFSAAAAIALAVVVAAPASAHVHVVADNPTAGQSAILTFSVPNESDTGSPTTQLKIALPNLTAVTVEAMPGWAVHLDRDLHAGTVSAITWTAAPGGGIGPDQFSDFRVSVRLPDTATASFPATQTYGDGTVVRWDQPQLPGAGEPEHPVPMLTLAPGHGHGDQDMNASPSMVSAAPRSSGGQSTSADVTARWLAGAALGLAVVAMGVAFVVSRRRT